MKTAKKLAGVLLALTMVLALSVNALAAGENGSITVDNPVKDQTYTAYKIFDVKYNSDKTAYSYTISGDSEWFDVVAEVNGEGVVTSKVEGLTFTKVNGKNVYNVIKGDGFSAAGFAVMLKENVAGKTGKTLTAFGDTVKAENLDLGYYFVTSTSGALCNLTTTDPSVVIHDKTDIPFDKVDDKVSADVGETVTYTITGKVPDYTGFSGYTYLITDTMSEGLTFNQDSVKVTVGTEDKTSDCTITKNVDGNANKFTVSIPVMANNYTIGAEIKVTYTAVVNEKAIGKVEKNQATLTYSNNPTDTSLTGTSGPKTEEVYTSRIVINKYDADSTDTKLAGAKFVLYKLNAENKLYYKWDETKKIVKWVTDIADATVVETDTDGSASFNGLANGTYYLEETAAPAGYNMMTEPKEITINGGDEAQAASLTVTADVANSTGPVLPSTGGIGTTVFYIAGAVLVVGAVVLLVTRKRMSNNG